jgi:hypothetical protein
MLTLRVSLLMGSAGARGRKPGSLHSADSGRDDTKKGAEVPRGITRAERYCVGAGKTFAGVLALNLSRRDRNRADLSLDK